MKIKHYIIDNYTTNDNNDFIFYKEIKQQFKKIQYISIVIETANFYKFDGVARINTNMGDLYLQISTERKNYFRVDLHKPYLELIEILLYHSDFIDNLAYLHVNIIGD